MQCNTVNKTINKILACLDSSKALGLDEISSNFLKDGAGVLALPPCNLVNLSVKQSLFPDECNITKLKPYLKRSLKVTRKITGPSHCLR